MATADLPRLTRADAPGASGTPRLGDDPAYAADPVHDAAPEPDALTPLQALAVEHIFGDAPFVVEARLWGVPVRYRILTQTDKYLVNDGADDAQTSANAAEAWKVHALTRSVLDIGGEPPLKPDAADSIQARFDYFNALKSVVVDALFARLGRCQALYQSLVDTDVPKSSGTPAGGGRS